MLDALKTDPIAFEIPFPEFLKSLFDWSTTGQTIWTIILAVLAILIGGLWIRRQKTPTGWNIESLVTGLAIIAVAGYGLARLPGVFNNYFQEHSSFAIYWYGIIIIVGIGLGAWWAGKEIERRGQSVDELYNGLIAVVFSGYIFARFTYVILDVIDGNSARYENFGDVINIRAGGVNILGGFIGAFVVGLIFARWRKLKIWHYADVAGPALLIAQAIGRWGNFINQELYGPPTTLPWGITIDPQFRLPEYSNIVEFPADTRFHPTFLYESLLLLLGFFVLIWLNKRYKERWQTGTLFGIFLIWWGAGRAFVEFFRPDQPTIGDSFVTYSMVTAVLLALFGIWFVLKRNNKLPKAIQTDKRRVVKPKPVRK
jgi:phosphatidylglycerol:prolipoprotein diacylglycerol transferase